MTTLAETNDRRTARDFWQGRSYNNASEALPASELQPIFNRFLPRRSDWSAIEIGACPGSHLLALARSHGYRPVALDFLPQVHALPTVFRKHGIKTVEVIEADFLTLQEPRRFNVVMSW